MSSQAAMRTAIKEIRRGEELMNVLQSHLQLQPKATDLSQGVIQALSAALSSLKSRETTNTAKASGDQNEAVSGKKRRPRAASAETNQSERDQKKKRKDLNPNSWTVVTPAPYLDGHQWRKYGQKINKQKSKYPRSYYRCTHSGDQGCPATKIVQEEERGSSYSPLFKVVYNNKHACSTSMSDGAEQIVFASPPTPSSFFIFESQKSYSSFQNSTMHQEILSPIPITEDSSGEMFSLHNSFSLIDSSTLPDLKTKVVEGKGDVISSAPMIKDFPMFTTGLLDYLDFDFGDVDGILSSLE